MSVLVSTENLSKCYGNYFAVNNVNITLNSGAIVGLVGRNGAGKTTLIRLLTGLIKPTSGTFQIMPEESRLDTSVSAVVEKPSVYANMTAMNNLRAQSLLLGIPEDANYFRTTLELVGLNPDSKVKAQNFSLGMRQRLGLAMALVGNPKLLFLDEPTNGLDPQGIHDMREIFIKLNRQFGTTLLISSHILSELGRFATEFYFMEKGCVIHHATAEQVANSSQKRLRANVSDSKKAVEILSSVAKVQAIGDNIIEVLGDVPATQVLLTLAQNDVVVTNLVNLGDNLESYFINLLNGGIK